MCARASTGELVVYANRITRTETDDKGEETEREIPFLKGYTVFNAEQCEGLPAHYYAKAEPPALPPLQRIEAADRFFAATGAEIRHGGTRAYYAEGPDYVQMPPFETFRDAESYAATLAHELTHWTKHDKRLARDMGRVRWGDEGYAKEELVAELGSAFLCADLDITPEVREDHAAYIAHWLKALKDDKRLIFTAAAHAQRAADYLHVLQPKQIERGAGRRIGGPFRRPSCPCPALSTSTAAAISGAIWWRCARRRPCPGPSSRPCSNCARITARRASATPPSAIASRACSPGWSAGIAPAPEFCRVRHAGRGSIR